MTLTDLKKVAAMTIFIISLSGIKGIAQQINIVSTAVPFLRISPDARIGAMGDVGIAISPDANSSFINQSKLPFADKKGGIGLNYTPWLGDITQDVFLASLAGYYKLDDEQALSSSLRYFSLGNIQFTDYMGVSQGDAYPREFSLDFGYSRKLSSRLSMGVAMRFIYSKLANSIASLSYKPGTTLAADLSVYYDGKDSRGQGFTFGSTLTNLGGKIGYSNDSKVKEFIPANWGIGAAYTAEVGDNSYLTLAADINKLLVPAPPQNPDSAQLAEYRNYSVVQGYFKSFGSNNGGFQSLQAALGVEFNYENQFFGRMGYHWEGESMGDRKYFSLGVGVKYSSMGLNFSYLIPSGEGVTRNPLSNTLRFGVTVDFKGKSE